ncbi:MAG: hypothetical protein WAO69_00100 [Aestuariivita sp.]|uniref:hypothetical protein n=1 Tax=Aestuariivita sp. TaxID=1872407 RepID=UPI003BAE41C3
MSTITKGQVDLLASAFEREASDASDLGRMRVEMMLRALAGLSERGLNARRAVDTAAQIAEHVETCLMGNVARMASKQAGRPVQVTGAQPRAALLAERGPALVDAVLRDFDLQREALLIRRKEAKQGITRK